MRINKLFARRRNGSLALEAVMVIPVIIVFVLLTRFVLDAMLLRHETAVYTRGSTVRAAAMVQTSDPSLLRMSQCWHDDSDRNERPGVIREYGSFCYWRNAETALAQADRLGQSMIDQARGAGEEWLLDDLQFDRIVNDVRGWGGGSVRFEEPPYLAATPGDEAGHRHLRSTHDFWSYSNDPLWAQGHDRAVWDQIGEVFGLFQFWSGPQALFPDVFPSHDR
jgi:hypothetical protein